MTATRKWLAGAGISAALLLGAALPALAQDADTGATTPSEQSTAAPSEDGAAPGGADHDCGDRSAGDAASEAASDAAPTSA